ncbi:MAG: EAL domain-containing protein, partial [Nocardioidaceae bacterium]
HASDPGGVLDDGQGAENTDRENELEKFASLVDLCNDFIAMAEPDGAVTYVNRAGRELVGLTDPAEALGRPTDDYFTDAGRAKSAEIEDAVRTKGCWTGESELHHFGTGESIPVSVNSFLVTHPDTGAPLALATVQRDLRGRIRDERQLADRVREQRAVAELGRLALTQPLHELMRATVTLVAERYGDLECALFRRSVDGQQLDLVATSVSHEESVVIAMDSAAYSAVACRENRIVGSDRLSTTEVQRTAGITPHTVQSILTCPVPAPEPGGPWGVLGLSAGTPREWTSDDTAFVESLTLTLGAAVRRYELEDALQHQALHDSLTKLPNRALATDRIQQALARSARHGGLVAVMLLDLDDFKTVNDSLGHGAGDLLLTEVSGRLQSCVRAGDTVARLGGDEFVVVCDGIDGEQGAAFVAEALLEACAGGFELDGRAVHLSASLGVSLAAGGDATTTSVLAEADIAMYRAKRDRPGTYRIFDEAMRGEALGRLNLAGELRAAVRAGDLTVVYQPILDLRTSRVSALEALCRWTTASGAPVPPDVFVPLAEETGLIGDIGAFVLCEAARAAAAWQVPGAGPVGVRVNVSAHELRNAAYVDQVLAALADAGLDPSLLGLEITESVFVDDDKGTQQTLSRLRDAGLSLMIDDFGKGYSSLSYLQRFPAADVLKIDRIFLGEDSSQEAVIAAVAGLGRSFGFRVCAEGVETAEQLARVIELDCDFAQGFHIARPAPAAQVPALIAEIAGRG